MPTHAVIALLLAAHTAYVTPSSILRIVTELVSGTLQLSTGVVAR